MDFRKKLRKGFRKVSHRILTIIYSKKQIQDPLDPREINSVLVVRINYRIGNILFTTPVLNALEQQLPHSKIDMIVGAPYTASLIEGMPQINQVYSFPRFLLRRPIRLFKFIKQLNANQYDLLLIPSILSSSDRFFSFVVKSRFKVGFHASDVFVPFTHSLPNQGNESHEALKPLPLMHLLGAGENTNFAKHLDIRLSEEEKQAAKGMFEPGAIGIFRDAKSEKKIENGWWQDLLDHLKGLQADLKFVDILDPNQASPLNDQIAFLSEKNLRVLAAKISHLDAFICGDTGPMHLAGSVQIPTIALFKATSPSFYGTLGAKDLSLDIKDKTAGEVAAIIVDHLKGIESS